MGRMMRMMRGADGHQSLFLVIPNDVEIGKGWKVDQTKDKVKSQTIYFLEKIEGDMAEVSFKKKTKGKRTFETQQGTSTMDIDNLSDGILVVNKKTGLIKTFYEKTTTKTTINMMGSEMPSTGTTSKYMVVNEE
jgi:hypothetical protein